MIRHGRFTNCSDVHHGESTWLTTINTPYILIGIYWEYSWIFYPQLPGNMFRLYLITPWSGSCVQPVPAKCCKVPSSCGPRPICKMCRSKFFASSGQAAVFWGSEEATRKRHVLGFLCWDGPDGTKTFFTERNKGLTRVGFCSFSIPFLLPCCFLCLTECWIKTDFEKLIAGPVMKKKALDVVVVVDDDDDDDIWHFWNIFSWPRAHRQNRTMWRCGSLLHAVRCNISDRLCPSTVSWVQTLQSPYGCRSQNPKGAHKCSHHFTSQTWTE